MGEDAADGVQSGLARHAHVVSLGEEHVDVVLPQRDVVVAAVGRHPHERLGHEAREQPELAPDLPAHLAVGGQPVGGELGPVELEVELELPRSVLVVALDHVEAQPAAVVDHPVDDRLQLRELVDVVAVGAGSSFHRRRPVGIGLEPHHLGLAPHPQVQSGIGGELLVQPAQVASTIRGEVAAGIVESPRDPGTGCRTPAPPSGPRARR